MRLQVVKEAQYNLIWAPLKTQTSSSPGFLTGHPQRTAQASEFSCRGGVERVFRNLTYQTDMMILKRGAIIFPLLLAACAHAPQHAAVAAAPVKKIIVVPP